MDTHTTRVTRVQAAALAGVDVRTISRWRAAGLLTVKRDRKFRRPAEYDRAEVLRVATLKGHRTRELEYPDNSDIST